VHAVKIAYADQRRAEVGRDIVEFVKNLHGLPVRGCLDPVNG
jgi:hypothetical protein